MVTPDSPGSAPGRSPSRWALAGALVVLAAALGLITRLTAPAADSTTASSTAPLIEAPTTTSTAPPFQVSQIEQGPPIEWARSLSLEGERALAAEYKNGSFHLFTTASGRYPEFTDQGLRARRSVDGITWETMHNVVSDFAPYGVVGNSRGWFAYGVADDGHPTLWRHDDGGYWERVELPGNLVSGESVWFYGGHATDDLVVLVGETYVDALGALANGAVESRFPGLRAGLDQRTSDPADWTLEVSGPLWLPLFSLRLEEAGITIRQLEAAMAANSNLLVAWIGSSDGRSWQRVVLADRWASDALFYHLEGMVTGPDGRIWARGYGATGWLTVASGDGVDWEEVRVNLPTHDLRRWGDIFVSVGHEMGIPTLRTSTDLETWESLGTNHFLQPGQSWGAHFTPVVGLGPAGFAMTARSHRNRESDPPGPVQLTRDGFSLEYGGNRIRLLVGDDLLATYPRYWESSLRHTRLSDDGTSVVFSDPGTGEDLVAFTLEELQGMEEAAVTGHRPPEVIHDHHVLIFSPDGERWTVQDLSPVVGPNDWLRMVIGDDRIVVVSQDDWNRRAFVWVGIPPR